jgi:hypothetical protein
MRSGPEAPAPTLRFQLRPLAWIGLAMAVLGSAPLLSVILAAKVGWMDDPNPNPVGFGILAMCTFWPGIVMFGVGVAQSITRLLRRRTRVER